MNISPEIFYGLGALAFALAIAWGIYQSSKHDRSHDPATIRGTARAFDDPSSPQHNAVLNHEPRI